MTTQAAAGVALAGYVIFLLLAFGVRSLAHYRRTGSTGFVGLSGRPGSVEWFGGVLFAAAMFAGGAAPILQLTAAAEPFEALVFPGAQIAGVALFALGVAATLWAQFAMGDSWRIGVDHQARTDLVMSGPFRWVRNPIFSAMTLATLGLVLLVPNAASLLALLTLVIALEIQVRLVEEPYLTRVHGEPYRRYLHSAGRFLPGLGRLAD